MIRTNLGIKVICKCGETVALTMVFGGLEIEGDFTETMAEIHNNGGKVEFIDTNNPEKLGGCKCEGA